ncbi:MAG: hypothetical protein ABJB01_08950 [Rudaea sp.]
MNRSRFRISFGCCCRVVVAMALLSVTALHGPDATAAASGSYSIDFHVIGAGGNVLQGSCFRLSGTVGQPAPGYSSGSIDSLIAGYWARARAADTDEIFYNGFEDCSS